MGFDDDVFEDIAGNHGDWQTGQPGLYQYMLPAVVEWNDRHLLYYHLLGLAVQGHPLLLVGRASGLFNQGLVLLIAPATLKPPISIA